MNLIQLLLLLFLSLRSSNGSQRRNTETEECEYIQKTSKYHELTGGIRFFDFPSPETLELNDLREGIEQRKQMLYNYALTDALVNDDIFSLVLGTDLEENVTQNIIKPILDCLYMFQDPDFVFLYLVRTIYMTNKYDDLILPYIEEIPLWLTKGETLRVYWSENHIIMYASSAYLLRQKFPDRFPADNDPTLDERLLWFLRSKSEHGFFEFYSQLYMRFTLASLLNLYDFAEDPEIKALTGECLTRFLSEWVEVTTSYGISSVVSGRTFQLFYMTGDHPGNHSRTYGYANQQTTSLITGLGPLIVEGQLFSSTVFLMQSSFDLTPIAASYTPELYVTKTIGASYGEGREYLFTNLSTKDRLVAQMSMGGYANPNYINDFVTFVETYEMWDHEMFSSFKILKSLPAGLVKTLTGAISSVVAGSLLNVPEVKIYKNHEVMLSSLNKYYSGFKVYQQFPWAAVVGDESVFTQSLSEEYWNTSKAKDQMATNNQMPFLVQDHNTLVVIYNPNADLNLIGSGGLEVGFSFNEDNFDEILDARNLSNVENNWIFGRRGDGYIAVFRHCINDKHRFKICYDTQQLWLIVVGNNRTHESFSSFTSQIIDNSDIVRKYERKCVSVKGTLHGKEIDERFCRNLGNAYIALIWIIVYLLCQVSCCFVCCRRKRRVWKSFVAKSAAIASRKEQKVEAKPDDDETQRIYCEKENNKMNMDGTNEGAITQT